MITGPKPTRAREGRSFLGGGVFAAVLYLFLAPKLFAQGGNPQSRISAQVDDALRTLLPGNIHPLARAQYDQGLEDPASKLDRITMAFRMTAAQQADLDALLAQQQDRSSPNFHRWLSPEEYATRFGIAQSDMDTIAAWLRAQGLTVVETARSRNWVAFTGTSAQVQTAFRVEIHRYSARGTTYFANANEPSVPSAFAGLVQGFRGLNNYPVKPPGLQNGALGNTVQPDFTVGSTNHYLAPDDFQTIYDLKALYSSGIDGTGQKIAIMGQTDVVASDIAAFRSASGLPASAPQMVLAAGSSDPGIRDGDVQEASLDLEWSGAVAPHAAIIYVYSTDVFASLEYAIGQNLAPVMSISYGACEEFWSTPAVTNLVSVTEQANAQGITIVAASGDGGAADCNHETTSPDPFNQGLTVSLPSSLPYVTGVGGTQFNEGNGTYWSATNDANDGSALSYIPEEVWNTAAGASGGGASVLFTKPVWQTGTGVPADNARDVPDVSLNASPVHDAYLVCTQVHVTPSAPLAPECFNTFVLGTNALYFYGGTSFGAPAFAGIVALINQKAHSTGQGNINYVLYPLAASSPTAFHDITSGNNLAACEPGSTYCPNGEEVGYHAGLGYDQATGLGSVDGFNLVNGWSSIAVSSGGTPTLISIAPNSVSAGLADFTLTANGSNFASNAQILWNGSASGVTMQSGGTPTQIKATISHALATYGTLASIAVANQSSTSGESSTQTFTVTAPPPINDNFANSIAVTSTPFTSMVDNSSATTEATDPTPPSSCAPESTNTRTKTVWWSFAPGVSGDVTVNTTGSAYDTILSVWTGTAGNLTAVACNDDIVLGADTRSWVTFAASSGKTYYFMVTPFGPPDSAADQYGGKTALNVSAVAPAVLTASPTAQTVVAGSSVTFQIFNNSNGVFGLTCSNLPSGTACSPASIGDMSSAYVTISTTSRVMAALPPMPKGPLHPSIWIEISAFIGICFAAAQVLPRKRRLAWVPVAAVAILLAAAGCGGSGGASNGAPNPNGTPAGTYTITVIGSYGATRQIVTVSLTVN